MSLTDFSFTQLFCALNEAAAEPQLPLPTAEATESVASTVPSSAVSSAAKPPKETATLSTHDCVLLKLSLTCAICGRLLRHQPAAIETCGHCFCYNCINVALENGCAPLTAEWPWCTLAEVVGAAQVRWAAATGEPASAKSGCTTATDPPGVSMHATGETTDEHHNLDEVQAAAAPALRAALSTTVLPSRQPRKMRKLRQVCPLCLGPAFKWMLVPLPTIADLCTALHAAYPEMEKTLGLLTAASLDNAAPITESGPALTTRDEAEGQVEGDQEGNGRLVNAPSSSITDPFAARPLLSNAEVWRGGQGSQGEKCVDDEKEQRRRRGGGPRKEITFAADIASRVPNAPAPIAINADVSLNQTSQPVADGPCTAYKVSVRANEEHSSNSAEAEEQEGSLSRSALAASLQFSADLIPSPALSPATTRVPSHQNAPHAWPRSGALNALVSTPMCREDVLGNSPADANDHSDAQQVGPGGVDAMVSPHPPTPAHHYEDTARDNARVVSGVDGFKASLPRFRTQRHPWLPNDTVQTPPCQGGVPSLIATPSMWGEETDGLAPSSTCRPILLDSIDVARRAHASPIPGCVFLWDGVQEEENLKRRGSGQSCSTTPGLASRYSYSAIRTGEISEGACSKGGAERCGCDADREQPRRAGIGTSSTRSSRTLGSALCSVHPQDIWELHTALARRHPRLPSCFAALRHGRIRWQEDVASEPYVNEPAAGSTRHTALQPPPPILCVAGHYPKQPCPSSQSRSSSLCLLATLTPAVCTALVIGVPCLDMAWVVSPTSSPWTAHAVSGWKTSTAVVDRAPLLVENGKQGSNAFQDTLNRLTAAPQTSSKSPRLAIPLPASWMATTQRALLEHLHPTTQARGAQDEFGTDVTRGSVQTYQFFLLPDGATRQLVEMLYHQWNPGELCESGQTEDTSPFAPTPHQTPSRKRGRDAVYGIGVAHDGGDWSVTDGHPQRAWRRLLLVAGGAVVELSWMLFEALVTTTTALECDDSASDADSLENSLTSHLRHLHASVDDNLWVHVDVADYCRKPSPSPQTATGSVRTNVARDTLFLLYSTAVARDVFTQLVSMTGVREQCTHISPSSHSTPASTSSGEHGAPAIRAYLQRFKTFLDRLATLVALAASPVLPGSGSSYEGAQLQHEARPSSWLLENIAQGRCCADSSAATWPIPEIHEADGDDSVAFTTTDEVQSSGEPARTPCDADFFSNVEHGAEGTSLMEEAAPPPLYRAGVYRTLLYADTP
ncbi:hypothetical protein JKF63_01063 [Porcisia hertigi]|uniref:RING-type domain-containing protein n=1 Tax=Porcisia hertigi TaxID=2761500 RepID=A0A836L2Z8_9TRYP|nr:hypothetical protein JKF63_01063 [Porcisia hertigi]